MRCVVGNVLVQSPWPETSPSGSSRRGQRIAAVFPGAVQPEEEDGPVAMLNEKSVIILNSAVICYFCVELNRAPKIIKFFV